MLIYHYEDGRTERRPHPAPEDRAKVRAERIEEFPIGTRVKLVALAQTEGGYDDLPHLPPGSIGTVNGEPDSMGSLPIEWDHGSSLAATSEDIVERIDDGD